MTEHTSNAPHESGPVALLRELLAVQADREALARALDAALAERDRLRQEVIDLACQHMRVCDDRDRLRDAARAFLLVLDRHQFSSVALRGKELDELRRLCE